MTYTDGGTVRDANGVGDVVTIDQAVQGTTRIELTVIANSADTITGRGVGAMTASQGLAAMTRCFVKVMMM